MKISDLIYFNFLFFILTIPVISQNLNESNDARIKIIFNEQWMFSLNSGNEYNKLKFNDSNWEKVNLPHTWNKNDAFDENKNYYRGEGFYRKKFSVNPEWKNKKVFIYFEGANQVTDVYLNEASVGQHIGGYTAFAFDITSLLSTEHENLLAVKVDNSHNKDIPPLNADFTFYGGIYRDVWLVITDPIHIDVLNYASPGVFIDTPELSTAKAKVRIWGTVLNETNENAEIEILNKIIDMSSSEVASVKSKIFIEGNNQKIFRQTVSVENPQLWSPDSPYLYNVVTEIYINKILIDNITNPLGVRWFSLNSQSGFYLNDKHLKLAGTNRHQDYEGYGNALPDSLHERDLKLIKENGFNFLRLAHYPQDPAVLKAADELGLIVWEEIPVVNMITLSDSFNINCKTMLLEMIRQHYNHPSILMWGYMNEVMLREPEKIPDGYYKSVVNLAKELEQITKAEDRTRATAMALSYGEIENKTGIDEVSDIIGMNLYFGWYYETTDDFGRYLDGYHKRNPYRPVIISEYGAGSDERVHSFNPEAFDFSTECQQIFHERTFTQILERDFILGSAVWNQFDFGSNHRQDTKPLINQKGLYYLNRIPKDISYYYKAKLSDEPVLHIAADDWKYRFGFSDEQKKQPVKIYTNLDTLSVYKDDILLGDFATENSLLVLHSDLNEGKNIFKAKGEFEGKNIVVTSEIFYSNEFLFFSSPDKKELGVNLGADIEYIDNNKINWIPGNLFGNRYCRYSGGSPVKTHHRILNTADEPLYQTAIEGIEDYSLIVPDGSYEVELHLAEFKFNEASPRIFNIYINDVLVFENLDLIKEYGQYKAVTRRVNIIADNNRGIEISFKPLSGKAIINGIRIKKTLN